MSKNNHYKSNNNIIYSCKYHVILCPKYRKKIFRFSVENTLKHIISDCCAESRSEIIEMEIMPDHIHLLVEVDPQYGVHKLIKTIKGRSSRIIRSQFNSIRRSAKTLWTNSYFISTVGGAPLEVIKQYVENQKEVI